MKKKLKLNELNVKSFVTEEDVNGGAESIIISVTLPICPSMYTCYCTITVCTITVCTIDDAPIDEGLA